MKNKYVASKARVCHFCLLEELRYPFPWAQWAESQEYHHNDVFCIVERMCRCVFKIQRQRKQKFGGTDLKSCSKPAANANKVFPVPA
jgi:hypothetical protein